MQRVFIPETYIREKSSNCVVAKVEADFLAFISLEIRDTSSSGEKLQLAYLSIHPSIHPSIYLSIYLSIYPSIYLSI